jgi:hypothetical protein
MFLEGFVTSISFWSPRGSCVLNTSRLILHIRQFQKDFPIHPRVQFPQIKQTGFCSGGSAQFRRNPECGSEKAILQ